MVIVAGGPSVREVRLEEIRRQVSSDVRWIAINNAVVLVPWADVLYACDLAWWQVNKRLWSSFGGLKLSVDKQVTRYPWNIQRVGVNKTDDRLELFKFGTVGWAGNSGFHAFNLAVQFGATRIVLVGYDMQIDQGLHWHGKHMNGLNNPKATSVERWRRCLDAAASTVVNLRIQVLNASLVSALQNYPKMTLTEALEL